VGAFKIGEERKGSGKRRTRQREAVVWGFTDLRRVKPICRLSRKEKGGNCFWPILLTLKKGRKGQEGGKLKTKGITQQEYPISFEKKRR